MARASEKKYPFPLSILQKQERTMVRFIIKGTNKCDSRVEQPLGRLLEKIDEAIQECTVAPYFPLNITSRFLMWPHSSFLQNKYIEDPPPKVCGAIKQFHGLGNLEFNGDK